MTGRYTVKAVTELAGIGVRTLRHYDHIDLMNQSVAEYAPEMFAGIRSERE